MNLQLQKLFSIIYSPDQTKNSESGASSIADTRNLRIQIENLFKQYNIKSIFDAGCNDCGWMARLQDHVSFEYHGGDISLAMVADVWARCPELDVQMHDVTTDLFPTVDLLFVRDVAIHLNNQDKRKLWQNWIASDIPWILITHNLEIREGIELNDDFEYTNAFPFASANWEMEPWKFLPPTDIIWEHGINGRAMGMWHQNQFADMLHS
jgi:hypothetical protein